MDLSGLIFLWFDLDWCIVLGWMLCRVEIVGVICLVDSCGLWVDGSLMFFLKQVILSVFFSAGVCSVFWGGFVYTVLCGRTRPSAFKLAGEVHKLT